MITLALTFKLVESCQDSSSCACYTDGIVDYMGLRSPDSRWNMRMKLFYTDGYYDTEKTYLQMRFKTYVIRSILISDDDDDINTDTFMDFEFLSNGLHSSHAGRSVSRSDELSYTIMGLGVCNDGTFHIMEDKVWKSYKYTVTDTCTSNPSKEDSMNKIEYYPGNIGETISETRTTLSMSSTSETKSESISNGYASKMSATLSAKFKKDIKVYKAEVGVSASYERGSSSIDSSGLERNDQIQNSNTITSSRTMQLEAGKEYAAIEVTSMMCIDITCKLDQDNSIITYSESPCFSQTVTHFRTVDTLDEKQKNLWTKSKQRFNDVSSLIQLDKPQIAIRGGKRAPIKKRKNHNKFNRKPSVFSRSKYLEMKKQKCINKYR